MTIPKPERERLPTSEKTAGEERYRTLFNYAPDGIIISSPEEYYLDANPSMCKMLGYSHKELIGMQAADIVIRSEAPHLDAELELVESAPDYNRDWNFKRKDGSVFLAEVIATIMPDGNLLAMIRDITERKQADEAAARLTRLYAALSQVNQAIVRTHSREELFAKICRVIGEFGGFPMVWICVIDPETKRIQRVSHWGEGMDTLSDTMIDMYLQPESQRPLLTAIREGRTYICNDLATDPHVGAWREAAESAGCRALAVFPIRQAEVVSGAIKLYSDEVGVFQDEEIALFEEVAINVSFALDNLALEEKRLAVDEELRSSQEFLKSTLAASSIGTWTWDIANDNVTSDEFIAHMFSIDPASAAIGLPASEYLKAVFEEDKPSVVTALEKAIQSCRTYDIEYRVKQKDGELLWVQAKGRVDCDADSNALIFHGAVVEIAVRKQAEDERNQLEDQYRQAQKMESVGVLAGGIAHDFNNLLTAINGYSDLTLKKMPADDPLRHNVKEVRAAGERAADLTSQLLTFSRKKILIPLVHNLNSTISTIEKMLRRILREDIELRIILEPNLGNIKADPGQIEQIIMNLATNARDAMPNGGTLTIETQNAYLDEQYVKQHAWVTPGPSVKMTVTDTGVGIDAATQKRIFEPFFTTKEMGKGTGLGLSTVFGIVKQSGGHIMVYSEIGLGTTFKIYLPSVDEAVERPKWRESAAENLTGTETILLVEDEEIVRKLVCEILTAQGYTVLEAANGSEALSLCGKYLKPIHLLLTDMIMPGISGAVLKAQIIELLPDIKVLFMSGYTDDSISSKGMLDSDAAFIEKPFTPNSLVRKVHDLLAS